MKTLDLKQMEVIHGEKGGFGITFACGLTVLAAGAFIFGTGGIGAVAGAYAAGAACGGLIGAGAATGNYI